MPRSNEVLLTSGGQELRRNWNYKGVRSFMVGQVGGDRTLSYEVFPSAGISNWLALGYEVERVFDPQKNVKRVIQFSNPNVEATEKNVACEICEDNSIIKSGLPVKKACFRVEYNIEESESMDERPFSVVCEDHRPKGIEIVDGINKKKDVTTERKGKKYWWEED
ncbi:MAG TPA: hypothetical protein VN174_03090 [Candidatus Methanoperedens sp.]|nr:hypothetical protein [Candidatus Methanoperedens sp.]